MDRPVFDVEIQNGSGECPQFTVTMHYFGPQMRGEEHNRIVMRSLKFIEDALNEKIARDAKGEVRNALPK